MPHQPTGGQQPGERAEELLAMVAHELRRPLTSLLGALATLQQRGQTLSVLQQQELLGMAGRQGQQLQRLLEQLLAAAGLDRGQARLARRSLVDVAALAQEAGRAARLGHLTIGSPSRLLGRCWCASTRWPSAGSSATCSTTPPPTPRRERRSGCRAAGTGSTRCWSSRDQGPGVPPADRDRVFERYTRGDHPTTSPSGGLGLGLYIARRLARADRGDLRLTDPPDGRGARFELRLPLVPPVPGRPPQDATRHR
jgi:signal transduction histidine kinase